MLEMEKLSRRHGCYKCRFMYAATSRALEDSYSSRWIWVIVCLMATQTQWTHKACNAILFSC